MRTKAVQELVDAAKAWRFASDTCARIGSVASSARTAREVHVDALGVSQANADGATACLRLHDALRAVEDEERAGG